MHAHGCHQGFWPFFTMGHFRFGGGHGHGHAPPPWVIHLMGGAGRAERGEVRWLILDALRDGPSHGYEIIQTIEKRSAGSYRPSPGTIYPTLQLLEEMELVRTAADGARKVYELTDAGRAELEAHQGEVDEAYGRMGGDVDWSAFGDLEGLGLHFRRAFRAVKGGVRQGRVGREEIERIRREIEEALERVEAIVSGKAPKG